MTRLNSAVFSGQERVEIQKADRELDRLNNELDANADNHVVLLDTAVELVKEENKAVANLTWDTWLEKEINLDFQIKKASLDIYLYMTINNTAGGICAAEISMTLPLMGGIASSPPTWANGVVTTRAFHAFNAAAAATMIPSGSFNKVVDIKSNRLYYKLFNATFNATITAIYLYITMTGYLKGEQ